MVQIKQALNSSLAQLVERLTSNEEVSRSNRLRGMYLYPYEGFLPDFLRGGYSLIVFEVFDSFLLSSMTIRIRIGDLLHSLVVP